MSRNWLILLLSFMMHGPLISSALAQRVAGTALVIDFSAVNLYAGKKIGDQPAELSDPAFVYVWEAIKQINPNIPTIIFIVKKGYVGDSGGRWQKVFQSGENQQSNLKTWLKKAYANWLRANNSVNILAVMKLDQLVEKLRLLNTTFYDAGIKFSQNEVRRGFDVHLLSDIIKYKQWSIVEQELVDQCYQVNKTLLNFPLNIDILLPEDALIPAPETERAIAFQISGVAAGAQSLGQVRYFGVLGPGCQREAEKTLPDSRKGQCNKPRKLGRTQGTVNSCIHEFAPALMAGVDRQFTRIVAFSASTAPSSQSVLEMMASSSDKTDGFLSGGSASYSLPAGSSFDYDSNTVTSGSHELFADIQKSNCTGVFPAKIKIKTIGSKNTINGEWQFLYSALPCSLSLRKNRLFLSNIIVR